MIDESSYYQSRFVFDARRDTVWKEISGFLQSRYIPEESTVLEIGAGYCHFINQIKARERHALDISNEVRRHAAEGVTPHVQSCTAMDIFSDDHFDVVFASNVFEHLKAEESTAALAEIRRVLKPQGKLVLIQPNFKYCYKKYFDYYTHIQIFTHIGMSDLIVASGFRIADLKPRFLPFSMKSNLPKVGWLVRMYLHSPIKPFAEQMLVVAMKRNGETDVE